MQRPPLQRASADAAATPAGVAASRPFAVLYTPSPESAAVPHEKALRWSNTPFEVRWAHGVLS